jgi:hypothetical protein
MYDHGCEDKAEKEINHPKAEGTCRAMAMDSLSDSIAYAVASSASSAYLPWDLFAGGSTCQGI